MRVCSFCQRCYDDAAHTCMEEGHPPLAETIDGSAEMIGGYRLELLLDSGIKGDTFRARQTACGRSCLVTIHRTDSATQFLKEANLAASLFHPNMADVYEAGTLESGECFVVVEDPEDKTLRQRLRKEGSPGLLAAIETIRQTAEALHTLHEKGLIHRAMRPENIILGVGPTVRIQNIDFDGVAARSIISNKFLIDSAIDSIRYFAPEQCSGEPVSTQSDVYSLGVILYEMLAGSPPFDAATAAGVIDKHRNHRPPDIRIDNFELRMLITHTLMESLHKRPERRQSSANAFARQLRHIEQLATHVSTPPPVVNVKPPRRIAEPAEKARPAATRSPELIHTPEPQVPNGPRTARPRVQQGRTVAARSEILADEPSAVQADETSAVQTVGTAIANFVMEKSAPAISHFSRLKERRKKLHSTRSPASDSVKTPEAKKFKKGSLVSREAAAAEMERELAVVQKARAKRSKKVEWIQPEDDIPTLADVRALMAPDEIFETPVVAKTQEAPAIEATVETFLEADSLPAKIEVVAPQPARAEIKEADIEQPVGIREGRNVEAIAAAQSESIIAKTNSDKIETSETAAVSIVQALDELKVVVRETAAKPQPQAPAVEAKAPAIFTKQPEKRMTPPAVIEKTAVTAVNPNSGTTFLVKPRGIRISGIQSGKPKVPIAVADLEEITLVSPSRSRFRVDVNKPQPERKPARRVVPIPSTDSVFYPTLLGGAVTPASSKPAAESILETYYPASAPPALPYRSLAAGTGLVLLIAFFVFAGDAIWKFSSVPATGDSVSAKSSIAGEPVLPSKSANPVPPSRAIAIKAEEKTQPQTGDEETPPPVITKSAPSPSERPAPVRAAAKPAAPERTAEPRPAPKPEPIKHKAATPAPIPVRSNGATRPRIVKVD